MKQCSKCGEFKSLEDFPLRAGKPGGWCRSCRKLYHKNYSKKYYQENKNRYAETGKDWRNANAKRRANTSRLWWENNKEKYLEKRRLESAQRRFEVLQHYGGNPPKCACCGENHVEFLSIDHIEGGGTAHRRSKGFDIYRVLKNEGFPVGYRVLCMNCNTSYGFRGYCPHERERTQARD